jgi:hypothetical protein
MEKKEEIIELTDVVEKKTYVPKGDAFFGFYGKKNKPPKKLRLIGALISAPLTAGIMLLAVGIPGANAYAIPLIIIGGGGVAWYMKKVSEWKSELKEKRAQEDMQETIRVAIARAKKGDSK